MGMKPRVNHRSKLSLDPGRRTRVAKDDAELTAKAAEAVDAAACYFQEQTKVNDQYRFTDAEAAAIIRRTANGMAQRTR